MKLSVLVFAVVLLLGVPVHLGRAGDDSDWPLRIVDDTWSWYVEPHYAVDHGRRVLTYEEYVVANVVHKTSGGPYLMLWCRARYESSHPKDYPTKDCNTLTQGDTFQTNYDGETNIVVRTFYSRVDGSKYEHNETLTIAPWNQGSCAWARFADCSDEFVAHPH